MVHGLGVLVFTTTVLVVLLGGQNQQTQAAAQVTTDSIAPSMVTDLEIKNFECKSGTLHVVLGWTAPGNDGKTGTANRYDIRVAQTSGDIFNNFTYAAKIEPGLLISGTFQPKQAGQRELIVTKIPQKAIWRNYVFALITSDTDNNMSPISNTVSLAQNKDCSHVSTTKPTATTFKSVAINNKTTHKVAQEQTESSSDVGAIIGGVLGALVVIGAVAAITMIKHCGRKVKLHPDPLNAKMTEPSVPYKTFVLTV